jgi:glycosyltransferase involved in cell wall biosynthesis
MREHMRDDVPQDLLLFYEEPDPDRWFPGDHLPRRFIRRLVRGRPVAGGQRMVFLNLCAGLDRIGVHYRVNDFRGALRDPKRPVGIIGKPHLLSKLDWQNPILFGASIMSHPLADPGMLERHPIRRVLVPGPWMRDMCRPYWGDRVHSWPVGIDTDKWAPSGANREIDVVLYDKVRWDHDRYEVELLGPVRTELERRGLRVATLRYGYYRPEDYAALLRRCRSVLFLCEHETQGLAYQQALSSGVPVLAWDRGGYWQDPEFYPARVKFGPVSSVPYWDERCGHRFCDATDFAAALDLFWSKVQTAAYSPRDFVLENLTLAGCAQRYLEHWREAFETKSDGRST